jgi:glycosyltransferase involved in cell wall biosynthesis
MTKFWMNVTSSSVWHTTPVGIVRVERELSLRIAHKPFVIDGHGFKLGDFHPRPAGTKKTGEVTSNLLQRNKAHGFLKSAQMFSQKQRFIKSVGYFISSFYGINSKLDRTLDKIVYYLYTSMRRMYTRILEIKKPLSKQKTSKMPNNVSKNREVNSPFSEGDIVFTCGLDWDNSILERIQSIKGSVNFKLVTVIYDLIPITHPEYIQNPRHANRLLGHFTLLAQLSDLVLVNTHATEVEFRKFCSNLEIDSPKIRLVPWASGFDSIHSTQEVSEVLPFTKMKGYFLAVGTIEIRKNYQLLVNTVRLAREKNVEIPHFVFVGAPGWGTHELTIEIEDDELLQNSITWLRNTSDEQLKWLYQNCAAFLSPSFNEGFGLPVAEAQTFMKHTYLSDIPVYRELFPNSTFISPNDPAAWLSAITQNNHSNSISNPIHNWNESSKIVAETISDFFATEITYLEK